MYLPKVLPQMLLQMHQLILLSHSGRMSSHNLCHSICSGLVAIKPYSLVTYDMMMPVPLGSIISHPIIHLLLLETICVYYCV